MSRQDVEDVYPLSPGQQAMLLYLVLSGSRAEIYFNQFVLTLGPVDPTVLRRSWQRVVDRHPALRTLFLWEKQEQPVQAVRRQVELPWQEHDWRHLPEAEREERLAAFQREDHDRGFELNKAPLTRIALVRWTDEAWKLVWSYSHLVLDGWSIALVLGELRTLYAAWSSGREPELPAPRPYRDYVGWLKRQDPKRAEEHWRRTLAGFDPPTLLPGDGTGAPSDSAWASAQVERRIGGEVAQAVQALARHRQITPNTLFQGLWGLLLGRWSAMDDVVYGAVVSGRPYELDGVESMVGLFINTLPVRLRVDPAAELIPWLQRLQAEQFEQRELEYSSHEQILVWAGMPRHTPLFESLLVYENFPVDPMSNSAASGALKLRSGHMTEANNVPLTLYVYPGAAGYDLKLSYHWSRFSGDAAERILDGLEALLAAVLATPESRLGDLSLVRPAERAELIAAAAGPALGPARLPVHRQVQLQAVRTPDAVAVTSAQGTLTYRELDRAVRHLAGRLRASGVGPESIVGLCAERSLEMVTAMLAILEAGGAYLPLDPAYPSERLGFMLDDSGARVLLAQERLLAKIPNPRAQVVLLDGAAAPAAGEDPLPDLEVEEDLSRLAYVIYTSGSTGRPKGVLVSHASLAHYVESAVQAFGITEADRVLQFASISFDTSGEEIYPCLTRGATLVLRDDEMVASLDRFAREVGTRGVTVLDLPTAYWHELVAEGLEMPASLRLVILGGEQAQRDRLAAWRERTGDHVRLVNTYGPTEATIVSTRRELSGPAGADFSGEIPIGRPIEDAYAYVAGPGQELMPAGLDGELLLGGAGLARGYLGRPDLTAERFVPDPFSDQPGGRLYRTGDLARLGPGGDLQFRGRTDHQVKVRGYRIELGEIEASLRAIPSVRDAVVVAREAGEGGKRLTAYVVPAVGHSPTPGELSFALRAALPDYMVPAAFPLLGDLPRTPSGKVDRRAVARLPVEKKRSDFETEIAAPRNQIEEVLCGIWSQLLGVERIGIHDDFFQLGGHSLLVAKLAARIRQTFHAELSMVEVFKTPTIAALAVAIQKAEQAEDVVELPPVRRAPRDQPIPLSFPQERVWFLDQLSAGGNIAYNFQATIWFRGPLQVPAFHRTLTEIVRRHEVLRTSFPVLNGQPVQVIHPAGPVDLPVIDLSQLPEEERKALAEEIFFATAKVPFDLKQAPLIRWRLLRLTDDLWELIQIEHHFVHDGWSFAVLLQEIKAIYPAFLRGEPSPLPEPTVQYADFAVWQREWMAGPVMDRLLGFWTRKLAGAPRGLEIATDRPRPARGSFAGDVEIFHVPLALYDALRKLSRREGFTLYMTMLAGFFTLLQRYTGESDMVIGTSNANRTTRDIEGMIGMVVNSLLLRGDLSGNPGFRELLGRVRDLTLEVYAHQDMPFERLVQELKPERQIGRNPLFQIMYNFHDAAVPDLEFGNLQAHFAVRSNRSAKMDMNIIVIPRAEQRAGRDDPEAERWAVLFWEYNTDLFDRSTILRMINHYLTLLAGVVEDVGRPLSELPLLTPPERQELLAGWEVKADHPAGDALHRRFEAQAQRQPAAVAVTMGEQSLTYGELNRRANRLAHRLRALGVGPEAPVPLCVERSLDLVVGILGILKAGGGYVPVDPSYPAERIDWILTDSQAGVASPVLVTQTSLAAALLPALPESRAHVLCLDSPDLEGESDADLRDGAGADNLAYVIYTSGSTGQPKGVPIRHRHVARLFSATDDWFGFGAQDVWTLFHSFAFDFSVWEIWGALLHGGRLVVVPYLVSRSPEAFYLELVRERVTVLNQTPSAFRQLIAAEAAVRQRGEVGEDLALSWVIFGGEALELGGLRPWFERHGDERPRLINMYGITETTVHVTWRPVTREDAEASGLGSRIGRPIPDLSVHLLDGDGNLVPVGVPGEIHVGGAGLSSGYLNRPDLTAERFVPDPFAARPGARLYRSGDLARVRPGGDLEYLGRSDHQVKIRGFRIELGEIEAALARHPAVREAAVLARTDGAKEADGEARLVAYVVARSATAEAAPAAQDLRQFLKASLPEHMIPSAFVMLEALPLTPHGKVDRKALPAPEATRSEAAEYLAPRSDAEETLATIWSEVLGVERVGVRDDFFLLGGHSLAAARILSRVRDALGVDLSLLVVFETPTVEGMATAAAAARPSELLAGPPALATGEEALVAQAAGLSDEDLDALLEEIMEGSSS